jgi:hypothetical protein
MPAPVEREAAQAHGVQQREHLGDVLPEAVKALGERDEDVGVQ